MKPKILAIDLDGTLLNGERVIPAENIAALRRAEEAGIIITLASGRIRTTMAPYATQLGLPLGPQVCCNGADVIGISGEPILSLEIAMPTKKAVLEYAMNNGMHLNGYTHTELIFLEDDAWGDMYLERARAIPPRYVSPAEFLELPLLKALLIADASSIQGHARKLAQDLIGQDVHLIESEPEYLEVLLAQADKSTGLQAVCQQLSIGRDEVAAIGDYMNDFKMIQWAGQGAVVANGDPRVKAVAHYQVPSNEECGVAWFIDNVLLND